MSRPPTGETQPERTALSWQRLGLALLAVAGLLAHGAVLDRRPAVLAVAGAVAALALLVLGAVAPLRYRGIRRAVGAGAGAGAPRLTAAATALVLLVGLIALAVLLS